MKPGDDFFGPMHGDNHDLIVNYDMSKREFVIRFVLTAIGGGNKGPVSVIVHAADDIWKQINEVAPLDA